MRKESVTMKLNREIIDILQQDGRAADDVLASMLGSTEAEVAAARSELEESGIIRRYGAVLDTEKLEDAPAEAFIELKVAPQRELGYDDIARRIYSFSEVKALYLIAGRCDLIVKIEMQTMKDISQFVWEKLAVIEGVVSTETIFIMRKYKEFGEIFVEQGREDRLVVTP